MSRQRYYVECAGWPVRFAEGGGPAARLVPLDQASRFPDDAEAWLAAHRAGLPMEHCRMKTFEGLKTESP